MKIIEHDAPDLKTVKMKVDEPLHEKLTKYPAIDTCFARSNFTVIAGKMGAGKTSILIEIMRNPDIYKRVFHQIFVIIPSGSLLSIADKDNIFDKHIPAEDMFNEYTEQNLETIYNKLVENAEHEMHSLVVIDDFGSQFRTQKKCEIILNKIIIRMRHLRCAVFLLAQGLTQLPLKWRQLATNLLTYNLGKSAMGRVFDEFFDFEKAQFAKVMTQFKNPHDFLLLNLKHKKIYNQHFHELSFEDEEPEIESVKESPHK